MLFPEIGLRKMILALTKTNLHTTMKFGKNAITIDGKKYLKRLSPLTENEIKSGKKFYFQIGEAFDGERSSWENLQHASLGWVEKPFWSDRGGGVYAPGPVFGRSELVCHQPNTTVVIQTGVSTLFAFSIPRKRQVSHRIAN